jgi:hypothetical protein
MSRGNAVLEPHARLPLKAELEKLGPPPLMLTGIRPKRAIGRLKGDNLVRQNHLVSFHEIFGCQLPRRYPSLLLQQSYAGTSVPGIDYQVASSATIRNTRSTITGEDRDNITPHNAIKTNTTHQDQYHPSRPSSPPS